MNATDRAFFRAVTLIAMTAAAATAYAKDDTTGEKGQAPCYHANYLVQVTWQPDHLPLSEEVMRALFRSSSVQSKPFAEVLGVPFGGEEPAGFDVEAEMLGEHENIAGTVTAIIHLSVSIDKEIAEVRPAADAYLHQVCERFRLALLHLGEQSLKPLQMRVQVAREEVERGRVRLQELLQKEQELRQAANQQDLDRDHVINRLEELRDRAREARMQFVIQNARRDAIERQIAEISAKRAEHAEADPVATELQKIVEIRKQQMERLENLHKVGNVSGDELGAAREQLAMAEAQLAERRQAAQHAQQHDMMGRLNQQLYELAIQEAELAAQKSLVEGSLEETRPLLDLAGVFQREVGDELGMARSQLHRAQEELYELERMMRMITPPDVTIIGDVD